jgi:hypothetical protein
VYPDYGDENLIGINSLTGINTLSNLFSLALNGNMIDVPVTPSNQQIYQATTVLANPDSNREPCAICQDTMESGAVRRINRCQHTFHQQCIDTWFQTGVTCPICRIDIRGVNDE